MMRPNTVDTLNLPPVGTPVRIDVHVTLGSASSRFTVEAEIHPQMFLQGHKWHDGLLVRRAPGLLPEHVREYISYCFHEGAEGRGEVEATMADLRWTDEDAGPLATYQYRIHLPMEHEQPFPWERA